MNEFFIDHHSDFCINSECGHDFCKYNPERFILMAGVDFYLITYYKCVDCGDSYDFRKKIIKKALGTLKIYDNIYSINRGVNVDSELKDFRIRNKQLRKYIEQINHIYNINNGRLYAITTKTDYLERICNQDIANENYEKAKIYLIENKYTWLLEELRLLKYHNQLWESTEIEYHKTIDTVIKIIKKNLN
jgi:hypothetical protein